MNLSRVRQIIMVGGVESFSVGVSGVTGLLIVNVLPKEQYAVYTFLITCLQLILGLSDLGLSKCTLPIVGQRSNEVPWVTGVCQQVFSRRRLMLVLSFAIVVPYGIYTFIQHQWLSWAYALAALLVAGSVWVSLRASLANTVLVILRQISAVSRITFFVTTTRLVLVCAVLLMPHTPYSIAILVAATVLSECLAIVLYRREFRRRKFEESQLSPVDKKNVDGQILKIAVPLIPSAIFFHLQGAIAIFLASMFGSASTVAEIGAFGRLAMALTIVDRVTSILLFPAIARVPSGSQLVSMISKVHITYLSVMSLLLLTAVVFPEYWILLLGSKYENMLPYVWILFLSSILMNGANFTFMTLAVRGFSEKQAFNVIFVILLQCAYLWRFGASTLPAILWFSVLTCAAHFVYQYALLILKWPELRKEFKSDLKCSTS